MRKLKWYVLVENFNHKTIEKFNIFDHYRFMEDLTKNYKKNKNDFAAFSSQLESDLRYYYWSKCEWEVIVSSWPPAKKEPIETKIDVYDQIKLNWDKFVNYTWEQCHAKRKKGE
jgi:hypothetical protein